MDDPIPLPEWMKPQPHVPARISAGDALRAAFLDKAVSAIGSGSPGTSTTPSVEKSAISKLEECLVFGNKILDRKPLSKDSVVQWLKRVRFALLPVFGAQSPLYRSFDSEIKSATQPGLSASQFAEKLAELETLTAHIAPLATVSLACQISRTSRPPCTKNVFIIHGHDELNTRRLDALLQKEFDLTPIVMLAKPGMTRPLTDKFEDNAQTCSFAFALFTPDDEVQKPAAASYSQARPNVIYEAGWFVGRLGKERVALLLKEGTRIHSDLDGVSRIRFTENIEDKFLEIKRELQGAKIIH